MQGIYIGILLAILADQITATMFLKIGSSPASQMRQLPPNATQSHPHLLRRAIGDGHRLLLRGGWCASNDRFIQAPNSSTCQTHFLENKGFINMGDPIHYHCLFMSVSLLFLLHFSIIIVCLLLSSSVFPEKSYLLSSKWRIKQVQRIHVIHRIATLTSKTLIFNTES